MATSIHVLPRSQASDVKELDYHVRSAVKQYNTSFSRLAFYGWRLKLADGFEELGFHNEYAYMVSLGVGKSWWYEAVSVGQALQNLPLEELEKIPVGQCQLLLQIHPELRQSYDWASEAKTDTYHELAQKIQERNKLVPGPERVPMAPLSIRVPATAKSAIFKNLEEFREKHDLSSIGQALEFAVAESVQGGNVLACLNEAIKLLDGVARSLARTDLNDEKKWLELARGRVHDAYRTILESSREDINEVHAQKIYQNGEVSDNEKDAEREDFFSQ